MPGITRSLSLSDATAAAPKKNVASFRSDVLRLASGTGIGQLIGIATAPIVTRLFAPEAYGIAAFFVSLTAILSVLACARYELAIVLPENDRDAANLFWLSLLSAVVFTFLVSVAVWLGGPTIMALTSAPELLEYLWLIPLVVLIHGVFTALNYWNTRTRHFIRLSIAEITSRVTGTAATLGAGFTGHATGGAMIYAGIAGRVLATLVLGGQIIRDNGRFLIRSFDWAEIVAGMKRYRKFPLYSSWSSLINIASWQLPIVLFGLFFSPAVVGLYALGFRILQMPMSLVGRAIGRVFHQRAAQAHLSGDLEPLVRNLLKTLTIVGVAPIIALSIIGEDLFSLAFGSKWAEAGVYTQILSVWAFVWFVSSPLSTLFGVLDKQAQGLRLQITIFVSRLVSIGAGAFFDSVVLALVLFSATGMFVYGGLIYQIMNLSGVTATRLLDRGVLKALIFALILFLALLAIKMVSDSAPVLVGIATVSIAGYFFLLREELSEIRTAEYAL